jgi:hypothetical protein
MVNSGADLIPNSDAQPENRSQIVDQELAILAFLQAILEWAVLGSNQ